MAEARAFSKPVRARFANTQATSTRKAAITWGGKSIPGPGRFIGSTIWLKPSTWKKAARTRIEHPEQALGRLAETAERPRGAHASQPPTLSSIGLLQGGLAWSEIALAASQPWLGPPRLEDPEALCPSPLKAVLNTASWCGNYPCAVGPPGQALGAGTLPRYRDGIPAATALALSLFFTLWLHPWPAPRLKGPSEETPGNSRSSLKALREGYGSKESPGRPGGSSGPALPRPWPSPSPWARPPAGDL